MLLKIVSLILSLLLVGETVYIATHHRPVLSARRSAYRFNLMKEEDHVLRSIENYGEQDYSAGYPRVAFDTETGTFCRAWPKTMPPEPAHESEEFAMARKTPFCPDIR